MGANMEISEEKKREYQGLIIRCPRLGGEVPFSFCEKENGDLPCRMVVSCWAARFPVAEYLQQTMTEEARERFSHQSSKDRLTTILDIAAAVKNRKKDE
jgi:hypothetical protein